MEKPRKQTYTMGMYLEKMKDQDIRSDQDVQRLSDQWNKNMVNELIATVLNDGYIPPIILGQETNFQLWVIDGLQRSTALMMFRYGNYKITTSIEEPLISYRAKVRDAEGNVKIDGNGDICWEDRTFDLKRKTYKQMPEELQKRFNEYQVETVIHEGYDIQQISKLVRRYNNLKAMNVSQRAFTFVDKYARKIREILKKNFFIECTGYTKKERKNGTLERIIMESVMCMYHLDNWKKTNQVGAYLNENSSMEEFAILDSELNRLENIIPENLYSIFTSKDSFVFFTLFHKFTQLDLNNDGKFADFMYAFKNGLCDKEVNGQLFYEVDKERSTKDKAVIMEKLDILETLMHEFLGISKVESEQESEEVLAFVREHVSLEVMSEDISQYEEVLEALMKKSNCAVKIMEGSNKPSLISIVAYSFKHDIDLDDWIVNYCSRNNDYISDQTENYHYMLNDLEQYMEVSDTHTDAA